MLGKLITFFVEIFVKCFNYVNWYSSEFILAALLIIICPITWNMIARWEFHTKIFSKFAGDNRLAADIFAYVLIEMGVVRNYIFTRTLKSQFALPVDESDELFFFLIGYLLIACGVILNFMVLYRLGIHGIFYADYFGILMKERVTAFPYNILENPLYVGSTMLFFGFAVVKRSPSGMLLAILGWIMYKFAAYLENPMTSLIYSDENINMVKNMRKERDSKNKQANIKRNY